MKTRNYFLPTAVLALSLILSACGGKEPEKPTPTPIDANAIAVQAIQTFSMGLTMTAFAQPTATATPVTPTSTIQAPTFVLIGTGSPAAAPTSTCDVSAYVQDVTIPDGTVMAPSQAFIKKWELKNTGTCTWTPTYKMAFGYGNPMGGQATQIGKTVPPGGTIVIEVAMIAPNVGGEAIGNWRMQNDKGEFFGQTVTVVIKVVGAAATGSATEEPTETPTATP